MAKDYSKFFNKPSLQEARKRKTKDTVTIDFDEHVNLKNIGVDKKYLIQTFGCQGNEADSETIVGILEQL
ncbi:MAG: tRNA (N6-isopentenyl adenosine(37)-C2)-methylthiotransferase MiaB, partial [Candidatus Izemoplasmataceae bacterium]